MEYSTRFKAHHNVNSTSSRSNNIKTHQQHRDSFINMILIGCKECIGTDKNKCAWSMYYHDYYIYIYTEMLYRDVEGPTFAFKLVMNDDWRCNCKYDFRLMILVGLFDENISGRTSLTFIYFFSRSTSFPNTIWILLKALKTEKVEIQLHLYDQHDLKSKTSHLTNIYIHSLIRYTYGSLLVNCFV